MATAPSQAGAKASRSWDDGSALLGLAELAFGSVSSHEDLAATRHLALLPTQALQLDLNDPDQRYLGDYELLEQIGEGGMGVVYRARQRSLDREVALKLLAAGPWASRDFIARFEREAQNAARMQHPNIVTVYEVGNLDGLHFFSMRLVPGESLSTRLKRDGRLAPRAAALLMRTVAEAVAYAHSLGVLHLDLKPANVIIDDTGVPFVADFGLARRLDNTLAIDNDEVSGTPAYMAPEQAEAHAHRLTAATDVWGLGAVLYQALTGQPPFRADTAQETVKLVLEGKVRAPRRWQPTVPLDLQAIVLRCLAHDPAERYASARAVADDLQRFSEGRPVDARPLSPAQKVQRWTLREPRLAALTFAAFAILVVGFIATAQQWYRADRNADVASANAATANARLWDSRNESSLRYMEDGQDWQAAMLLLANLREMEAAGDGDRETGVRKRLGIIRAGNPQLLDAIPSHVLPVAVAFDQAGTRVAVSGQETGLQLFESRSAKELMRLPGAPGEVWSRLAFGADGQTLLASRLEWSANSPRPAMAHMRRIDLAGGKWLAPPAPFQAVDAQSYSFDGRYAVLTLPDGRAQAWAVAPWRALGPLGKLPYATSENARLLAPDGTFFALGGPEGAVTMVASATLATTRIALGEFGRIAAWTVSPDSRWLALGDEEGHVVVVDTRSHAVRRLSPRPVFNARWLAFSADGRWLALATGAGGAYLWSWPDGELIAPPFSGNGSAGGAPMAERVEVDRARGLVFVTDATGNTALWQVGASLYPGARTEARQVSAGVDSHSSWGVEAAAWSPGSGLLAYAGDNRVQLVRQRPLALKTGRGAAIRPDQLYFDGRQLVEVVGDMVQIADALSERPIGEPLRFSQVPSFAELSPDGKTLVVASGRTLHVLDAATHRPRFAPIELPDAPARLVFSPDSRRIAVAWLASEPATDRNVNNMVVLHSLVDGRRLGGPEALPGPTSDALTFSADGSRLLAWNRREVALRDGLTLAPIVGPLEDFRPRGTSEDSHRGYVQAAAFDPHNDVELVHAHHDGVRWQVELRRYTAAGGQTARPLDVDDVSTEAILPLPDGRGTVAAAWRSPFTRVLQSDGVDRELPDPGDDAPSVVVAVSHDGRWLARARRDGVALFDLHRQVRVAALHASLARPDGVAQIAFSPDGNRLLARSARNRYLVWDLTPDERPVAAIAREQALRDLPFGAPDRSYVGRDLDAAERRALHAADPGTPYAVPVVVEPNSTRKTPGGAIPLRAANASDDLVDLTPYYTVGLSEAFVHEPMESGDFGWLPRGVQRLQGIDYDIRGGVYLPGLPPPTFDLATHGGVRPIGGIHALITIDGFMPGEEVANVRFDFADGSQASMPLRITAADTRNWHMPGAVGGVRIAAVRVDVRQRQTSDRAAVAAHAVWIANPHPERPVRRLAVQPVHGTPAPAVLLALTIASPTAEPAAN